MRIRKKSYTGFANNFYIISNKICVLFLYFAAFINLIKLSLLYLTFYPLPLLIIPDLADRVNNEKGGK